MNFKLNLSSILVLLGLVCAVVFTHHYLSNGFSSLILPDAHAGGQQHMGKLPDFSKISDVKQKKETFFSTLYPIIELENQHVLKVRRTILTLQDQPIDDLNQAQIRWLSGIAKYYKLANEDINAEMFSVLLARVDYIPPSLALTQAAIESGWGSSRFSKQGNNLFGQWCFSQGCGLVPLSRDTGKGHEVAKFASINQAVRAYIRNLNTHYSYAKLREKRAMLRENGQKISGASLAKTLHKYSEEGGRYVTKVTRFIEQNKLQRFTSEFELSLVPAKQ